jgi:hypothetical protein
MFAERLVIAVAASQGVVALAAEQHVRATPAKQGIVAVLPEQLIVARAAGDRVVAGVAKHLGTRQCSVRLVQRERVVAAKTKFRHHAGIGDCRCASLIGDVAAVDEDAARRVATERERVVEIIAYSRRYPGARDERGRDGHVALLTMTG